MLNAAVVGLGWWGKQIVSSLKDSKKINVSRGVDINVDSVQEFADVHGLKIDNSQDQVLIDPNIDAVILVTPHLLHEEQVLAAAAANKHIFCEKPFALNSNSARAMIKTCEENGICLGIGHERRFEPALEAVKTNLDSGNLGTLIHIECNWSHNNFTKNGNPK